jgi:hypothetical protein
MAKTDRSEFGNVVKLAFGRPEPDAPEVPLLFGDDNGGAVPVPDGGALDLTGKPKVVMLFGPGRSGKSLLARWIAERAETGGRPIPLFTMDTARQTLRSFFPGANAPPSPQGAQRFLEQALSYLMESRETGLIDFGADATIRHMTGVVEMMRGAGVEPVALYLLTPREGDLTVLARMEMARVQPPATALLLNIGTSTVLTAESGEAEIRAEFARITGHSAFKAAVGRGAVVRWMPRLKPAADIEKHLLSFKAAAETTEGSRRLGFFDRVSVKGWLEQMDEQFADLWSWLP